MAKYKFLVKPFVFVLICYIIALLPIIFSRVSFNDDIERAIFGHAWDNDFNRYSSSFLARLLNMNFELADIAPLPQIVAVIILSITSVVLVYVVCGKKMGYLPLVCSVLLGIQPLTIECWLYKFDAPCIALSFLCSVVPFLLWPRDGSRKGVLKFFVISLIGLLVMWTSYQASSGMYILICIFMVWKELLNSKKLRKRLVLNICMCILAYVVSVLVFKFCLPEMGGYRQTEMLSISDLLKGVLNNIKLYLVFIMQNLTVLWRVLLSLTIVVFVLDVVWKNRKHKLKALGLTTIFLFSSFVLSMGAYVVLEKLPLNGRSFVGLGMVFTLISIYIVKDLKFSKPQTYLVGAIPVVTLYSFIVFCYALSNGLADQERYGLFRTEELLHDLASVTQPDKGGSTLVQVQGRIGYSGVMQHVVNLYPLAGEIVTDQQTGLSLAQYGIARARFYYGNNWKFIGIWEEEFDCEKSELIIDNVYHSIWSSDKGVCINVHE